MNAMDVILEESCSSGFRVNQSIRKIARELKSRDKMTRVEIIAIRRGLNENGPPSFISLNTRSGIGGTFVEGLGGVALTCQKRCAIGGWALTCTILSVPPCLLLVEQDVSSLLFCYHVFAPPWWTLTPWNQKPH